MFSLQFPLQFRERSQTRVFEFADPAFGNVVDRHRIDEMKSLPALPVPRHQVRLFENRQVLRDSLTSHVQSLAKISKRLSISLTKPVEELATTRVRQCSKNRVIVHLEIGNHLVPCPIIGNLLVPCQVLFSLFDL